jgi:hypothetical protein
MGLMTDALGKGKKKEKYKDPNDITIEDTYGVDEEEVDEQPSLMQLFSQWTAEKLKANKGKQKMAEVD